MKLTQVKFFLLIFFIAGSLASSAQKKPAYNLYNNKGKKVNYQKMMKDLDKADIILFGEYHNNPISHWLQLEVTKDLNENNKLVLGAEMFEADNQDELNAYLSDSINAKELDSLARLWPNYKTDYAPLVNFAKKENIPFIATNIPRRYANLVYREGFEALDTLSDLEKTWMAPLPIEFDPELPSYKEMVKMMGGHAGDKLPKAQAIKDASMAYFTLQNYSEGETFIHYNGAFHSNNYEGILWYLKRKKPDLNYATISTVTQENIEELLEDNIDIADYIICVDEDMTSTH